MLKKLLIGIGILVLLLVIAVAAGPHLVDWNTYKPRVAAAVRDATGRDLAIDGNVSLSLLPSPTLSVAGVRLANLSGAATPDMAQLKSLDISVALLPLLSGNIQVTKVTLVDPVILFEKLADGRANWLITPGPGGPGSVAGDAGLGTAPAGGTPTPSAPTPLGATTSDGHALPAVSVDNFAVVNGTVIYHAGATEERIENLNARVKAASLAGPFTVEGDAKLVGILTHFDASVGRLGGGPTDLKLLINMAGDAAILRFDGTADQAAATLHGKLDAKIAEPPVLLKIAGARGLPPALTKPFTLSAGLDASAKAVELADIALALGEDKAKGKVAIQLGSPMLVDATLAFGRLDLDKLLLETQVPPQPAAASPPPAATTGNAPQPSAPQPSAPAAPVPAAAGFALPTDIAASLDLTADSIVYRRGVIDHPRLQAHLADGALEIKQIAATLPGNTPLTLAGTVAGKDGSPQFAGTLQVKSSNLRALASWLGAQLPPVAGNRLKNLTLASRVIASQRAAELADLDVKLDDTHIQGGVNVALPSGTQRTKPGFGIGLTIDKIDLDSYQPTPAAAAAGATATTAPANAAATPATGAAAPAKKASPLAALAPLARVDANFELRAGSVTLNHQTVRGIHLQGTIFAGKLTIADASVQDIGGGRGAISGSVVNLSAPDPRYDLKLDLAAPDGGQVFQLAGLGQSPPGKLGAVKVNGAVKGGADDVAFDLAFAVAGVGVQGAAKGNAQGLQGGVPRIDSTVSASAKNAGPLFQLFGIPAATAAKLGTLTLSGEAKSGQDSIDYNLTLDLPGIGGKGAFQGRVVSLSKAPSIATNLTFDVAQPGPLLALAGFTAPGTDKLGAMRLVGKANTSPSEIDYDLTLDMPGMGGKGAFQGKVTSLAKTPQVATNLKLDVAQPGPLLAVAGISGATAGKLGALGISGRLDGGLDAMKLALDIAALGGKATIAGNVAATRTPVAFDLTVAANNPNAAALMGALLGGGAAAAGNQGPFKLNAHLAGDARKFTVSNLALQSGLNDLNGSATVALGARPQLQGSFTSNNFNVGLMSGGGGGGGGQAAPPQAGQSAKPGQTQGGQAGGQAQVAPAAAGGRWSRQRLDLAALDKFDAALDYKAQHLYAGATRIDNAVAKINLAAGTLVIQTLTGQIYGGSFQLQSGRLVSRGTPSVSGRLITSNLEFSEIGHSSRIKGPISVNADFAATGASEADLVSSLQGRGKLAGRLTVLGTAEQATGTAVLNLLGKQLSAVRGVTGALSNLVNLLVGRPNELAGDFAIDHGVLTTQNTTATNPQARVLFHGKVMLPPWTMAMTGDVFQLPQTAKPLMTVNLQGSVDAPNVAVSGMAFQQLQVNPQQGNPLQQLQKQLQGQQSQGGQQPQQGGNKVDPLAPLLQQLLGGKTSP